MSRPTDPRPPDGPPKPRPCALCGGPTRSSHRVDSGGGETVDIRVCARCGATSRGAVRSAADRDARGRREIADRRARRGGSTPGRRPLDEGAPENPVLDEETASRLRDLLGG